MRYDFDKFVERKNTGSMKWDVPERELPMWVADMDFETAPEIIEAIKERAAHGVFGYSLVTGEWYRAYIEWWKKRHYFEIEKNWLIFAAGVVPAISSIVRKMTTVGENVLVQTPVYNIFFNSIVNNGRNVVENRLRYDGTAYHIDFADLEEQLSNPMTTMMIVCNPHNPVGKIWNKDTLMQIGELCKKYHVLVVSDEIHCDLTEPDKEYIPFASVSDACRENSITCVAPTKAFNLAGIQTAAVMVPNEVIRHRVWRGLNTDEVAEPNAFAIPAVAAAFTKGEEWLDELRVYLFKNRRYAEQFLKEKNLEIQAVKSDATYLLWLDCRKIAGNTEELANFIRQDSGLYLSAGGEYGKNGDGFLRMNIACPRKRLEEGLHRLSESVKEYEVWISQQC